MPKKPKLTEKQAEEIAELLLGLSVGKLIRKLPPGTELVIKKEGG